MIASFVGSSVRNNVLDKVFSELFIHMHVQKSNKLDNRLTAPSGKNQPKENFIMTNCVIAFALCV